MNTKKGLIHLYTGDGKGKTTAAVGLCVRAVGAGFKVLLVQFMKGQDTAELGPLKTLGIEIFRKGEIKKFIPQMTAAEKNQCRAAQNQCLEYAAAKASDYDLLVLDEVISAVTTGMVALEALTAFLAAKPAHVEVVLTGRDAPQAVREYADYISNIHGEKHPFEQGIYARKGIEF